MLLGGLWHGASWTFVVWGGLHGFYLWVEKAIVDARKARTKAVSSNQSEDEAESIQPAKTGHPKSIGAFALALFTFFLINVTWVFFRAGTFEEAWNLLQSMFGFMPKGEPILTTVAIAQVLVIVFLMVIAHWLMHNTAVLEVVPKLSWPVLGTVWSVLLLLLIWSQESSSSFIYFQF